MTVCMCGGKRWLPIFRCLYLPILQAMFSLFSPNMHAHVLTRAVDSVDLMSVRHPSPLVSFYDEWCPARGVVVVVSVRGTRGDHLLSACFPLFCSGVYYCRY